MDEQQVFFTADEVAHLLRVHIVTVRGWLRSGDLKGIAFGGRAGWRIRAEDLEAFIKGKSGVTTAQGETASAA